MELTNAKALIAKIAADAEVAKIFAAIKTAEEFEKAAKKFGYACTLAEFKAAKDAAAAISEKMSDDELSQTSGGLSLVGVDYAFVVVETT